MTALSYPLQHYSGKSFKLCRKPRYFLLRLKGLILNKKLFFTAFCAQILLVRLKQFRDLGTWAVLRNKNGTSLYITNTKLCLGSVQFSSVAQSCPTRCDQASLSITNSRSSLRLASKESVMPSSHLILCRPLLLLPPIPLSISLFQ